jgi:hypothetical protein
MTLLLLYNQPAATPTPTVTGPGGFPRNRPIPRYPAVDRRRNDDEVVMMLVAKYLEMRENEPD